MKKRSNKKLGVRHTTDNIKTTARDKRISGRKAEVPQKKKKNNGNGNVNPAPFAKSSAAQERLSIIQGVLAKKTLRVPGNEFAGNGKVLQILEVEEAPDPYNEGQTVLQAKILDAQYNKERIWNISAVSAIREVTPFIVQGVPTEPIRVWTVGTDVNTRYHAKAVNGSGGSAIAADFTTKATQQQNGSNNGEIEGGEKTTLKKKTKTAKAASKTPLKKNKSAATKKSKSKQKVSKRKTE